MQTATVRSCHHHIIIISSPSSNYHHTATALPRALSRALCVPHAILCGNALVLVLDLLHDPPRVFACCVPCLPCLPCAALWPSIQGGYRCKSL